MSRRWWESSICCVCLKTEKCARRRRSSSCRLTIPKDLQLFSVFKSQENELILNAEQERIKCVLNQYSLSMIQQNSPFSSIIIDSLKLCLQTPSRFKAIEAQWWHLGWSNCFLVHSVVVSLINLEARHLNSTENNVATCPRKNQITFELIQQSKSNESWFCECGEIIEILLNYFR